MSKEFAYIRKGISFNRRSAAPIDPEEGDVYYDSGLKRLRNYRNGVWQDLSSGGILEVTLFDSVDTTLPATTATLIDGVTVANGNTVLFTNLGSGNNEIYQAAVSGSSITWTAQPSFNGSNSPSLGAEVQILYGSVNALISYIYNGSIWIDLGSVSTIGVAPDASYADGLFTDMTPLTKIGTAVDRFNQVLKALAPPPAPELSHASMAQTGTAAYVSFGASQAVGGYTNVSNNAGGGALDKNGLFTASGQRRGAFGSLGTRSGTLADTTAADTGTPTPSYPANAFGNANLGTLKLEVNGVVVQTVDLTSFGSGASVNANGSGFTLSAATSVSFPNGSPLTLFKYRTGTWNVSGSDQRLGHNYVRVSHYVNSTDNWTNYWEWIIDTNSAALAANTPVFNGLSMTGLKNLSGVKYHTAGTAQYAVNITNAYKECYSSGNAISFTSTNGSIPSMAIPAESTDADVIALSGETFTVSGSRLLNSSLSTSVNCTHPTKSTLSSAGSASITGILMDTVNTASTALVENFCVETNRLPSNIAYAAQADVTGNSWTSTNSIANAGSAGYNDGLLFYNGTLCYPTQGANSGNFSGITNGPASNVNYSSSFASGTRYVYLKFQNNSGSTRSNFTLNFAGTGATFTSGAPTNSTDVLVEMKFPAGTLSTATGWMNAYNDFATNQWADGNGCRSGGLGAGRALNTLWGITIGTKSIAANEYVVVRLTASVNWTASLSQITLAWA